MTSTLSRIIKWLVVVSIVILAGYYFMNSTSEDEAPPALSSESRVFQGLLKDGAQGFIEFEDGDQAAYNAVASAAKLQGAEEVIIPAGVNYFHSENFLSAMDIATCVDPSAERLLIAYYSPGGNELDKSYYTYTKGPFNGTKLLPEDFKIPAGRGFALITKNASKTYCFDSTSKISNVGGMPFQPGEESGWMLMAANDTELNEMLKPYLASEVTNVWVQDAQNSFKKIQYSITDGYNHTFTDHSLVWIKVKKATQNQVLPPVKSPVEKVVQVPAPESFKIGQSGTDLSLRWAEPKGIDAKNIKHYIIKHGKEGVVTTKDNKTEYKFTDLPNKGSYNFKLFAVTQRDQVSNEAEANVVFPGKATKLTLSGVGRLGQELKWQAPKSIKGAEVKSHQLAYLQIGDLSGEKKLPTVSGATKINLEVFNPGKYKFTISATSKEGFTGEAASFDVTVDKPEVKTPTPVVIAPGQPGEIKVDKHIAGNAKGVTLRWDDADLNGGSEIVGYKISYSNVLAIDGSIKELNKGEVFVPKKKSGVRNLKPFYSTADGEFTSTTNSKYKFYITAVNKDGAEGETRERLWKNYNPKAPTNMEVGQLNDGPTLSWTTSETNGGADIKGYYVSYLKDGDTIQTKLNSGKATAQTSWLLALPNINMELGVNYSFFVKAVNRDGLQSDSTKVDYVPLNIVNLTLNPIDYSGILLVIPPAPESVNLTFKDGSVVLNWVKEKNYGYTVEMAVDANYASRKTAEGKFVSTESLIKFATDPDKVKFTFGNTYTFYIKAVDNGIEGFYTTVEYSPTLNFLPVDIPNQVDLSVLELLIPPTPEDINITKVDDKLKITWKDMDVADYKVRYVLNDINWDKNNVAGKAYQNGNVVTFTPNDGEIPLYSGGKYTIYVSSIGALGTESAAASKDFYNHDLAPLDGALNSIFPGQAPIPFYQPFNLNL
ncbi:fibronectin type III domain-containing protein [Candidatus Gracilibacteria bacterium]|nr:fibronectin type III domain-containing protein [Candidatus Gracilibacteria bacterium]